MWIFEKKVMNAVEDFGEDAIGFVYEVEHIPSGKKYIGKKILHTTRKKVLGKREYAALKEERKEQRIPGVTPKKKIVKSESDWKSYYGSSKEVKDLVKSSKPDEWHRTVLKICTAKKQMSYWETKYQFIHNVLETDNYLNSNIAGKWYRTDV